MGFWSRITGKNTPVARVSHPKAGRITAFDAGKNVRRLRSVPTGGQAINAQIRAYGQTVLARARYLANNNPYAASAKETYVSALVGAGIKPSWLTTDAALKAQIQEAWLEWTDEADADGLTDLFGLQATIAAEMFVAGECFVRLRPRRPEDGLSVPLQLQILPAEMLPYDDSFMDVLPGRQVRMGIEFNGFGQRTAYHFLRQHPEDQTILGLGSERVPNGVPASEVLHLFRPVWAGQIRGVTHTLSSIATTAIHDAYEDAELERKRTAALSAAFVIKAAVDDDDGHPFVNADGTVAGQAPFPATPDGMVPWEPGAIIDLLEGEDVKFSDPADVGPNYEDFMYRSLTKQAAGYGVPYAAMTGDLRQTSYGSLRGGLVEFRRRIEAQQHHVMVYQFCRPVVQRWLKDAIVENARRPVGQKMFSLSAAEGLARLRELSRVKHIPPKWEWVDPLKDRQAEKLAVDNGFKARSDVIEAEGYDPEEVFARIAADRDRAESLGLSFDKEPAAQAQPVTVEETS